MLATAKPAPPPPAVQPPAAKPPAAVPAPAQTAAAPPPLPTMGAAPPAVAQLTPIGPPASQGAGPPPPAQAAATKAAAVSTGLKVGFPPGKADLSPDGAAAIKRLVASGHTDPSATYNVVAYAAATPGDPSLARRLSLSRALAVRNALMADGIASSRIYVRALGSRSPPARPTAWTSPCWAGTIRLLPMTDPPPT